MWTITDEGKALLKRSAKPLTWRQMVADIERSGRVGLGADLLGNIKVTGISGWEALLLKLAWCKFDRPKEKQFEFLLKLQDETIVLLSKSLPVSPVDDALCVLASVMHLADYLHIADAVVERGILELGLTPRKRMTAWQTAMENWLQSHQPVGPSLRDIAKIKTADEMASLVVGPSPSDSKVAVLLLRRWAALDPKPMMERHFGEGHSETALKFLEWLVERVGLKAFKALEKEDVVMAKRIAESIVFLAKSEIDGYEVRLDRGALAERRYVSSIRSGIISAWDELRKVCTTSAEAGNPERIG